MRRKLSFAQSKGWPEIFNADQCSRFIIEEIYLNAEHTVAGSKSSLGESKTTYVDIRSLIIRTLSAQSKQAS